MGLMVYVPWVYLQSVFLSKHCWGRGTAVKGGFMFCCVCDMAVHRMVWHWPIVGGPSKKGGVVVRVLWTGFGKWHVY
jgi:hypothetical protein